MLVEGGAFSPAGMTIRQSHCLVKQSVSPIKSIDAAAMYGATSKQVELDAKEDETERTPVPETEIDEKQEEESMKMIEEEMRRPRIGRRPLLPTKADIDEHYPLHLNYRSWCEHCRAGKARLAPHVPEASDREKLGITISADFAFMGSEEAEEDMQPCLVIFDDSKRAF